MWRPVAGIASLLCTEIALNVDCTTLFIWLNHHLVRESDAYRHTTLLFATGLRLVLFLLVVQ